MSAATVIYLISLLSNLDLAFSIVFWFLVLGVIAISISYLAVDERTSEIEKEVRDLRLRQAKKVALIALAVLSLNVLVPSEKTMYLMVGAHFFEQSELPPKVLEIINLKLDSIKSDLLTEEK
jgi:hypothetical protein